MAVIPFRYIDTMPVQQKAEEVAMPEVSEDQVIVTNPYGDNSYNDRKKGITDHLLMVAVTSLVSIILAISGWLLINAQESNTKLSSMITSQEVLLKSVDSLYQAHTATRERLLELPMTFVTKDELRTEIRALQQEATRTQQTVSEINERIIHLESRLERLN